jgi:hypothetical protein
MPLKFLGLNYLLVVIFHLNLAVIGIALMNKEVVYLLFW